MLIGHSMDSSLEAIDLLPKSHGNSFISDVQVLVNEFHWLLTVYKVSCIQFNRIHFIQFCYSAIEHRFVLDIRRDGNDNPCIILLC